jgi:hypothetical protein
VHKTICPTPTRKSQKVFYDVRGGVNYFDTNLSFAAA